MQSSVLAISINSINYSVKSSKNLKSHPWFFFSSPSVSNLSASPITSTSKIYPKSINFLKLYFYRSSRNYGHLSPKLLSSTTTWFFLLFTLVLAIFQSLKCQSVFSHVIVKCFLSLKCKSSSSIPMSRILQWLPTALWI